MGQNEGMTLDELRRNNRVGIMRLAAAYGARNIRVFGSVARGQSGPSSDLDLLVDLEPDRNLMDLGGLSVDLGDLLRAPVDVATESMLRSKVRQQALAEAVPL